MVGRLRTSFRSGNINEDLRILLLKGLAAVAEVPRTEDVGADAVASLLRYDVDGNCYAEDSFVVQLKSQSASEVTYSGHELDWFLHQSLPMFLGVVSKTDATIALYPTICGNHAAKSLHANTVIFRFESSPHQMPWNGITDTDTAIAWLPEPLLTWTLTDIGNPEWRSKTYGVMKRFLQIVRTEQYLMSLGHISKIEWKRNDVESLQSEFMMSKGGRDDLPTISETLAPCLSAISMLACMEPYEARASILLPALGLAHALRQLGHEVDPSNRILKMLQPQEGTTTYTMNVGKSEAAGADAKHGDWLQVSSTESPDKEHPL